MFVSNKSKHTLESHRGVVNNVSIHENYNLVASGSEDCTIKIWDYDSGALEKTLKGHT
jgi:platelet-activating factor acetylhydrolase IB subunit alpha